MPSYSSINVLTHLDCSCKDVISCIYDLSSSETKLLTVLLRSKQPLTLETLANRISRDRGTVFRLLQKLVSLNLCTKRAISLEAGGYCHLYTAVDASSIKIDAEQRIRHIQYFLDNIRKRFSKDIEKMIKIT